MAPLLAYPSTWAAPPRGRVLVLAPHADDEVIGCGGAIALHVEQGDPVAIAIATDGMRGDPEGRFAGVDYRELRRREASAAAAALGASPPEGWDLPDQGLRELLERTPSPLVAAVASALDRVRPAIVYGPPESDVHPDHYALGTALVAALALRPAATRPRAFAYEVWAHVVPTEVLDVSGAWDRKERALASYASQLAYNDYLHAVRGLNAARAIHLPGARYVEAFQAIVPISTSGRKPPSAP
jgi:N-acetylglucosamine malate deacetylase 1